MTEVQRKSLHQNQNYLSVSNELALREGMELPIFKTLKGPLIIDVLPRLLSLWLLPDIGQPKRPKKNRKTI
jgi:hypothetical protein